MKILCSLPKVKTNKLSDIIKETKLKLILHDAKRHDDMVNLHSTLINTRNYGGFSALHLAAQNGHNQSCREILLAGGNPDVQNNVRFQYLFLFADTFRSIFSTVIHHFIQLVDMVTQEP